MTRNFDALGARTFDVAIIGGGITGACIAHDAALRGLSVALIEKRDFGAATSAASSKLLHGGIRYLQQLAFAKVRESARERGAFLRIAPHLAHWVPFLIPTTSALSKGRVLLGMGVRLHHLLMPRPGNRASGRPEVPASYFLGRSDLLERYPILESLDEVTGAWVIHELHMHSSERMTLAFLQTASRNGAQVVNYAEAVRLRRHANRVIGIAVTDRLTQREVDVEARFTINAAGPWIGGLTATCGSAGLERKIRAFSKGVHVVTRPLLADAAIAVTTHHRHQAAIQRGGRHLFVIPWRGYSLIGTTNVPYAGSLDDVHATRGDVDEFLRDINTALPGANLARQDVRFAFAGLYPLTETAIRPEVYQGSGHYQLVDHSLSGHLGFASALGAKFTTARLLAEGAVDLAARHLGGKYPPCGTDRAPLAGGAFEDAETARQAVVRQHRALATDALISHLFTAYGTQAAAVLQAAQASPTGLQALTAERPNVEAEIQYAVQDEMAVRLDDVVLRRTGLGTVGHPGRGCLERVAAIMAGELDWDRERVASEIDCVERMFTGW